MPRKHIIVSGRVQGVGFRYFTIDEARRRGVAGWARNRPDGTVEIEAQAEESALESFIQAVRTGPSYSSVSKLETTPLPESKDADRFSLRW